jgi:hypothetical protein
MQQSLQEPVVQWLTQTVSTRVAGKVINRKGVLNGSCPYPVMRMLYIALRKLNSCHVLVLGAVACGKAVPGKGTKGDQFDRDSINGSV